MNSNVNDIEITNSNAKESNGTYLLRESASKVNNKQKPANIKSIRYFIKSIDFFFLETMHNNRDDIDVDPF